MISLRRIFCLLLISGTCFGQDQKKLGKPIGVLALPKKTIELTEAQIKERMIGKIFPTFSFYDLDSVLYSNESLKGKVALVSIWKIGCMACMWEIPHFNQLKKNYEGKDFSLISMSPFSKKMLTSFKGEKKEWTRMDTVFPGLRKYFHINSIDYPILPTCDNSLTPQYIDTNIVIDTYCDFLEKNFNIYTYPIVFIVDKKGIVREIFIGFDPKGQVISLFTQKIDALLKE